MVLKKLSMRFIISWSILSVLAIFALLGNGFITVVNGYQWLKKRKTLPSDFLLICLSSSRVLSLLFGILSILLRLTIRETYQHTYIEEAANFSSFVFDTISLWCATWLSVLYCVKVTNFVNPFFFWLKPRINVLAPRLLGMSVVISMVASLPSFARYYEYRRWCNLTGGLPTNTSDRQVCSKLFAVFRSLQSSLAFINFSLSAITSILLLISLGKHITNLRKSGAGMKDASTRVHINVMKPLVFYLLGYLSHFTGTAVYSTVHYRNDTLEELVADLLVIFFPLAHTIMLILTNPRLKKASAHMLNVKRRSS